MRALWSSPVTIAAQLAGQEPRAARDVERALRLECRDGALELADVVVPARAVEAVEASQPEVPVVVLGARVS